MTMLGQNKWYVEPVPDEETEGWLLTYLDLITLLLVLLVVMLALSGSVATRSPAAPMLSGPLPHHSGLLPKTTGPDIFQVVPSPEAPVYLDPAIVTPIPALIDTDPLQTIMAHPEWDTQSYVPDLADLGLRKVSLFGDQPPHFQAVTDPDTILQHFMEKEGGVPVYPDTPSVEPEVTAVGMDLLPLPELGDNIEIIRNPESISFRINSEILYSSAKVDLSLEGIAVLRKLLPVLKDSEYTITVEGHTDALPIRGGQYPSNWELSSARAGRVVRYLTANGVERTRLRAIGYADTRALVSNDTEQRRTNNRRVDIVLEQPKLVRLP